jgi:histidinol-phosphate phosphatase family protein
MSARDVEAIHARAQRELEEIGARVDAFYFCPHGDEDACACRKPAPGLILRAAQDWRVDLDASFLVGDDERDMVAARRAGVRGHQLPTNGELAQALAEILGPAAR